MDQACITTSTFQIVSVSVGNVVDHRNGIFTWSNGGKTDAYDPPVDFQNGAVVTYRIEAGVKDTAGNSMGAASTRSFTVALKSTVLIESASALDGYGRYDGVSVVMDTGLSTMIVGDDLANRHYRSWITFPHGALTQTPTRILAATLSVYQAGCVGSPYTALDADRWDWLPTYQCSELSRDCDYDLLAKHVNHEDLDAGDFNAAILASGPELTEAPDVGWVSKSVTGYVQGDRAAGREATQFRLEFPVATNNDGISDYCWFYTGNYTSAPSYKPTLAVTFEHD
jgi:hypothetical protein